MQSVRIFFSKTKDAKYISHLDLMRCMMRAIARAEIPIMYTEGFNPRPYMNFAMSLPLGFEGKREALDIRISDDFTFSELQNRLSDAMPPDIKILEVSEPKHKASEVGFSKYRIEIKQTDMDEKDFNNAVLELVSAPEFIVSKVGKQGRNKVVKQINLTEHIRDFKISLFDETDSEGEGGKITVITLVLPSNPQFGINPSLLCEKAFSTLSVSPIFVRYTREGLLCADESEFE